ncbi:hypothetical protein OOX71_001369 [Salmonella enterica]|nr:hypothetical protein [Salmonella enterica]
MEKKTKELVIGDMVKNILNGKYYPMETVERSGAGYTVKLTPSSLNGNSYYAEYTTRHTVM